MNLDTYFQRIDARLRLTPPPISDTSIRMLQIVNDTGSVLMVRYDDLRGIRFVPSELVAIPPQPEVLHVEIGNLLFTLVGSGLLELAGLLGEHRLRALRKTNAEYSLGSTVVQDITMSNKGQSGA